MQAADCVLLRLVCIVSLAGCVASSGAGAQRRYETGSKRHYNGDAVDCQNVSRIVFLGFFSCPRNVDVPASEKLRDCDLLAEVAAQLAVEWVNEDTTILPPGVDLELYPIHVPDSVESTTQSKPYTVAEQILEFLLTNDSDIIWGVIGPHDNPAVTDFLAPISANAGLLMVSYGSRDASGRADEIPIFYRTLPSDTTSNLGRLVLLVQHRWLRIAVLQSSNDIYYAKEASGFLSLFHQLIEDNSTIVPLRANSAITENFHLDYVETFTGAPDEALENIQQRDINIIVGFFGPTTARTVLCKANSTGLISKDHAWILPSFYDPNWWKLRKSTEVESGCTDDDMREIMESVIFVDNIKTPPVDLTMDEFHDQLIAKSLDLFPSLTEEDLKPYLLRSRATNAYDAVTLLAKSVGVAFDQGGDSCTNTSLIQTAMEEHFMGCEFCRLSDCFAHMELECPMQCNITDSRVLPEDSEIYRLDGNLIAEELRNYYGQILFSQFLGGEHCPVVLWWPHEDYNTSYLLLDEFDSAASSGAANCVARTLGLSRSNFVSGESKCPTRFNWRGSSTPPSSRLLQSGFYISVGGLVAIGVVIFTGIVLAILLMIFNILWRNNMIVKATSPWLNVILLIGIILRLPTSLYEGLIVSASQHPGLRGTNLTPLCHFSNWQHFIGDSIFVASLIANNWRIYRIFHNKKFKERGNQLTDISLTLGILALTVPVFIILTAWSAVGVEFKGRLLPNENLQLVSVTFCRSEDAVFEGVAKSYILVLYLFLFILSLLTASVSSPTFRREGISSYQVAIFFIFPSPFFSILRDILRISADSDTYQQDKFIAVLWIQYIWNFVLPFIFLQVLFAPTIIAVVRNHLKKKHKSILQKEDRKLTTQYNELNRQAESLKVELKQISKKIQEIKAAKGVKSKDDYSVQPSNLEQCHDKAEEDTDVVREAVDNEGGSSLQTETENSKQGEGALCDIINKPSDQHVRDDSSAGTTHELAIELSIEDETTFVLDEEGYLGNTAA